VAARAGRLFGIGGGRDDDAVHAELLEAVARGLRAGLSASAALDEGARVAHPSGTADDLRRSLHMAALGAPLGRAIEAWVRADPTPARVLSGASLTLGTELGGAWARALDGAAAGLRDRAELAREVRALTSQARSSAAVMVLAPLAFAAYAWTTDPRIGHFVLADPRGWACVGLGAVLDVLGAMWMQRLTARVA
jgi:tight adherence protein B